MAALLTIFPLATRSLVRGSVALNRRILKTTFLPTWQTRYEMSHPRRTFATRNLSAVTVEEMEARYMYLKRRQMGDSVVCNQPGDVFVNNRLRLGDIQVYGLDYDFTLAEYKQDVLELLYRENQPGDVFVNNRLRLGDIQVYGFDYDFTLAEYKPDVLELLYRECLKYLIEEKKFPEELENSNPRWEFGCRGLHLDTSNGYLMKIDGYNRLQEDTVRCGHERVPKSEVRKTYLNNHIPYNDISSSYGRPRYGGQRFYHLLNLFSGAELALIANVMDHFRKVKNCNVPSVIADIGDAVAHVHGSGKFHKAVMDDIGKYVQPNPAIKAMLRGLKEKKKEVLMITNSESSFVNAGMRHIVGEDWQQLFDVIVTNARKPEFYTQPDKPFRRWDVEENMPHWERVDTFEKSKVYQGGCLAKLLEIKGWNYWQILYFGDDVYSDLADPALHKGIRTGCITPELKREISVCNSPDYIRKIEFLRGLEELVEGMQAKFRDTEDSHAHDVSQQWSEEMTGTIEELRKMFNDNFGSMFRVAQIPSFSYMRLARFADIYTSSITNLNNYSHDHVFFPRRTPLPHEAHYRGTGHHH